MARKTYEEKRAEMDAKHVRDVMILKAREQLERARKAAIAKNYDLAAEAALRASELFASLSGVAEDEGK